MGGPDSLLTFTALSSEMLDLSAAGLRTERCEGRGLSRAEFVYSLTRQLIKRNGFQRSRGKWRRHRWRQLRRRQCAGVRAATAASRGGGRDGAEEPKREEIPEQAPAGTVPGWLHGPEHL